MRLTVEQQRFVEDFSIAFAMHCDERGVPTDAIQEFAEVMAAEFESAAGEHYWSRKDAA